jgi:hypothetical protein
MDIWLIFLFMNHLLHKKKIILCYNLCHESGGLNLKYPLKVHAS